MTWRPRSTPRTPASPPSRCAPPALALTLPYGTPLRVHGSIHTQGCQPPAAHAPPPLPGGAVSPTAVLTCVVQEREAGTVTRFILFAADPHACIIGRPLPAWWQAELSQRALELLALPDDGAARFILDIGCGSCLSGDAISEAGHTWLVRPLPLLVATYRPCFSQMYLPPQPWCTLERIDSIELSKAGCM